VAARGMKRIESGLEKDELCFSLALVLSVLLSYHAFWYDWTVLLLPALLTLNHLGSSVKITTIGSRVLLLSSCALFVSLFYLVLARFGHTYALAVLLLIWCWALLREIQNTALPQVSRSPEELQAATA
jgi:hypothetical protein